MCVRLRKHRSGFCEVRDLGDRVETEPHMATCMRTLQLNTHRRVYIAKSMQKNYDARVKKGPEMPLHCQYLILWSRSTQMISKLLLWLKGLDIKTCWTKDDIELENGEFTRVLLETPIHKILKGHLIVVAVVDVT